MCSRVPVRVRIRIQALILWLALSLPSILVTAVLYVSAQQQQQQATNGEEGDEGKESDAAQSEPESRNASGFADFHPTEFDCYENYTTYYPVYESARFWIEGVLLLVVGTLGILGNILTLAVLKRSKQTKFNNLLMILSLMDMCLIVFFLLMSTCTVLVREPRWFVYIFPYLLWPLGNISITNSVLMVVAVSTERFLAICRPLQYKPSPSFYVILVVMTSLSVNTGRFFEYKLDSVCDKSSANGTCTSTTTSVIFKQSELMQDERYIIFSRYWTEIVVIGILPLLALIMLNYGIYTKIRKSTKFRKLHDKSKSPRFTGVGRASVRESVPDGNSKVMTTNLETTVQPSSTTLQLPKEKRNRLSVSANGRDEFQVNMNSCSSNQDRSCPTATPVSSRKSPNAQQQQNSSASSGGERSTKLLVGIVLVFFVCHVFRLVLQFDAVVHPSILGGQHFEYCMAQGRFPSPLIVWILTSFNNVFLVLNSSINFVVYCLMGRSFRTTLIGLFTSWNLFGKSKDRSRHPSSPPGGATFGVTVGGVGGVASTAGGDGRSTGRGRQAATGSGGGRVLLNHHECFVTVKLDDNSYEDGDVAHNIKKTSL